ncbi:hypothetical protein F511_32580 [Dorcoceras hygrometricum]|uniref:Uncharacterized protein n=1 Tax=Dorcoceras hygrometricum TaxID=472368 RepID=A0A2Z7B330_9LAMI|nr:hypothetical protein F511_32580 [Dorcoceras hygrometricum]
MHVAVKEHRSSRPANQLAVISIEPLYPHSVSTGEIIARTKLKTTEITYPKAQESGRTLGSGFTKTFDHHCYFTFLSSVDSGHLTGINRKSYSIRAQRHQSRSKQRRKSTTIYRRRVRMNSIYQGFRRRR